jgi:hypothetical protein
MNTCKKAEMHTGTQISSAKSVKVSPKARIHAV